MGCWTILDYITARGENDIRDWIAHQPKKAQAKIDTILRYLGITRIWPPQYVSALTNCEGILEVKIVSSGVQYRPLGYYGHAPREFTLLVGAVEKGGKLKPRNACTIAQNRRREVDADRRRAVPHQF